MLGPSAIEGLLRLTPKELRASLAQLLPKTATTDTQISVIEIALRSPVGEALREAMARWIVDEIVPVNRLVPNAYVKWRPPVRDAMMFVVMHLSPSRLAPKLLEQIELPSNTTAEVRLLRLIAKVPGLQKAGSSHSPQPKSQSGSAERAGSAGEWNSRRAARGRGLDHSTRAGTKGR
jgi:hypothetical protein